MALTDAGRALAAAAIDVEVALERAEQAIARFQDDRSGPVSVAAFHSAALAMFPALVSTPVTLSDFDVAQEDFPLLTAEHDLVLAHRLVGSPPWPASVRVEPLLFEPLDIAMRRDHPLASRAVLEASDLRDVEWVAVHEGFPLEQAITVIAGTGGSEARITHRINEFRIAAAVVAASSCVALLPRYTTDLHPDLVLRPLARPEIGRHIDCLARPETLERASVQAVLAQIGEIAAGLARP